MQQKRGEQEVKRKREMTRSVNKIKGKKEDNDVDRKEETGRGLANFYIKVLMDLT